MIRRAQAAPPRLRRMSKLSAIAVASDFESFGAIQLMPIASL